MNMIELNKEDIEKIEKLIDIVNRNWHCNSKEVTDLYNKYIQYPKPPVQNTNCTSCIRRRLLELTKFLNNYKKENNIK